MINLVHIAHHHLIVRCFKSSHSYWLNNHHYISLSKFTHILRVLRSKIYQNTVRDLGKRSISQQEMGFYCYLESGITTLGFARI